MALAQASNQIKHFYNKFRSIECITNVHSESKKLCHYTFDHIFDKCWPIFKILSLLYSALNLQQNSCHVAHHTSDVLLHYLAKLKI